jgi:hypothetical protein
MKTVYFNLRSSALIGLLFVLPFIVLELVNRQRFHEPFPVVLFGFMLLLAACFVIILLPIVRAVTAGTNLTANPVSLVLRIVCLVMIASLWGSLIADQMPCFLGVPNCD